MTCSCEGRFRCCINAEAPCRWRINAEAPCRRRINAEAPCRWCINAEEPHRWCINGEAPGRAIIEVQCACRADAMIKQLLAKNNFATMVVAAADLDTTSMKHVGNRTYHAARVAALRATYNKATSTTVARTRSLEDVQQWVALAKK